MIVILLIQLVYLSSVIIDNMKPDTKSIPTTQICSTGDIDCKTPSSVNEINDQESEISDAFDVIFEFCVYY